MISANSVKAMDAAEVDASIVGDVEEALLDAGFWPRRPVLQHIEAFAKARRVGPWAVLIASIIRAIAHVLPTVVLPSLVGSRTSLNMFGALVGPAGAGKDAADDVAADAFTWGQSANPETFFATEPPVVPLGTGEGAARTFRPSGTKPDEPNPVVAAIFTASEIDTWSALDGRTGSTLTPTLRAVWTGKTFGFANAGKDTRVIVPAHSYRACLLAGVQPLRSGPLLKAADGGLPQRFVWSPTSDVDAPEVAQDAPEPLPDPTPDWETADDINLVDVPGIGEQLVLRVPDVAKAEIDAHRLGVLRVDPNIDPLDGHLLVTRLKVAAGLMALDSRTSITAEDWELAGVVMEVSTITRDACQRALEDQARRVNRAKGHDQAERTQIVSDRMTDQAQKRVVRAICSKLKNVGRATRRDLRVACTEAIRGEFSGVFDMMLDQSIIVECSVDGKGFSPKYEFGSEYENGASGVS